MWESHWGLVVSIQGPKERLLLADHESGLHGVRVQVRQVTAVFANIKSPLERAHVYDQSMALRCLGNRPDRSAS